MRKTGKSLLSAGLLFAMILCMVFTVQAASPTAPQIASALQTGNGTVTVTWTKSPEARGYYLEYKVKGTSWKKTKTKDTTLTVGNLVTGKKYKFRVRAYTMTDGKKQYSKYSAVTKVKLSDMSATTTTGNTGNTGTAAQQSDPSRKNLSEALYKNSKAAIICGFDGYGSDIPGRHEGIDIRLKDGSPIYALADGEVIRVENGASGSNGLSTIAVYNKDHNKTVLYLHSNPEAVYVGKVIKTGDLLGTQGWRGVSSVSNSHTHVEVRNGKEDHAAKSVNNSVLENENPAPFWNSLGYNVK